jgi:hypothetical protein
MPLVPKPPRSTITVLLINALQRPKTPFDLLWRLSLLFVTRSALHIPSQTAAIIAGFILAAYLTALMTVPDRTRPTGQI